MFEIEKYIIDKIDENHTFTAVKLVFCIGHTDLTIDSDELINIDWNILFTGEIIKIPLDKTDSVCEVYIQNNMFYMSFKLNIGLAYSAAIPYEITKKELKRLCSWYDTNFKN